MGGEGGDKDGFRLTLFAQFILITAVMKARMMLMLMKADSKGMRFEITDGVGNRLSRNTSDPLMPKA